MKYKAALEKNMEYFDKYVQKNSCHKIHDFVERVVGDYDIKLIIDLGCEDGGFILSIKNNFSGIDILERRIGGLRKKFPNGKFYCGDVCNSGIKDEFDFVYSNHVIEYVEDDKLMVKEIKSLLKGGILYLSSVMKGPWTIYQYNNNGKFVLDPAHENYYIVEGLWEKY